MSHDYSELSGEFSHKIPFVYTDSKFKFCSKIITKTKSLRQKDGKFEMPKNPNPANYASTKLTLVSSSITPGPHPCKTHHRALTLEPPSPIHSNGTAHLSLRNKHITIPRGRNKGPLPLSVHPTCQWQFNNPDTAATTKRLADE